MALLDHPHRRLTGVIVSPHRAPDNLHLIRDHRGATLLAPEALAPTVRSQAIQHLPRSNLPILPIVACHMDSLMAMAEAHSPHPPGATRLMGNRHHRVGIREL